MKYFISHFLLLCIFCFFCQIGFSQKNYLPGTIQISNEKSLSGFINYKNWEKNPRVISFKESLEQKKPLLYAPTDIQGFHVEKERYLSGTVDVEISPSQKNSLEYNDTLQFETRSVFLQVIVEGNKNLYYLKDKNSKVHLYIKKEGKITLLKYKKFLFENGSSEFEKFIIEREDYKDQLHSYLNDCPSIYEEIKKMEHKLKSLETLFLYYYNCRQTEMTFHKKHEKIIGKPGIVVGGNSIRIEPTPNFSSPLEFEPSSSVYFTAGLSYQFILPRRDQRWSFYNELLYVSYRAEALFKKREYSNNDYKATYYSIGQNYLKINNAIRYTRSFGNFKFFVNPGISHSIQLIGVNEGREEVFENGELKITEQNGLSNVAKNETELFMGLGGGYKKFSLEFRYEVGNGKSETWNLNFRNARVPEMKRLYILMNYQF